MFYLQFNLNFVQMLFFSFKFQLVLSVYPVSSFPSHVLTLSFTSSVILNTFCDVVSTRCFIPVLCHAWWLLMNNVTCLINKSCTVKSSLWATLKTWIENTCPTAVLHLPCQVLQGILQAEGCFLLSFSIWAPWEVQIIYSRVSNIPKWLHILRKNFPPSQSPYRNKFISGPVNGLFPSAFSLGVPPFGGTNLMRGSYFNSQSHKGLWPHLLSLCGLFKATNIKCPLDRHSISSMTKCTGFYTTFIFNCRYFFLVSSVIYFFNVLFKFLGFFIF